MRRGPLRSLSSAWHRCRMVASGAYTCASRIQPPFPGPPEHATKPTSLSQSLLHSSLSSKAATQLASSPATAWWNVGALERHATGLLPQCGAMRSSRRLCPLSKLRQKRGVHTRGGLPFHPKSNGRDGEPTERRRRRLRQRQRRPLRSTDSGAAGYLGEQTKYPDHDHLGRISQ